MNKRNETTYLIGLIEVKRVDNTMSGTLFQSRKVMLSVFLNRVRLAFNFIINK